MRFDGDWPCVQYRNTLTVAHAEQIIPRGARRAGVSSTTSTRTWQVSIDICDLNDEIISFNTYTS